MKRCKLCDQPMLPKGARRKHPDDYRHASGCPNGPVSLFSEEGLRRIRRAVRLADRKRAARSRRKRHADWRAKA